MGSTSTNKYPLSKVSYLYTHIQGLWFNYKNCTLSYILTKRYNIYLHTSQHNSSTQTSVCLASCSFKHLYIYQQHTIRINALHFTAQHSQQKSQIHKLYEFIRTWKAPNKASTRSDHPINKFKLCRHIQINELVFHILSLSFNYNKLIKRIQLSTWTNQIIPILIPHNLMT
jgi:hypothetical protein